MFKTFILIATFIGPADEFEVAILNEYSAATTCNSAADELNEYLPEAFEVFCDAQETPYFRI